MAHSQHRILYRTAIVLFAFQFTASCGPGKEVAHSAAAIKEKQPFSGTIGSKYAELLGVDKKEINDLKLYTFIDDWYGTPYKYGGKNKSGIDCSNFTSALYKEVYKKQISGSSSSLFEQCRVVSKNELREGDLVFFRIGSGNVSHLGVYLLNNKFVHATTKKGVMIDNLDAPYYKKHFYKGGRIK